mmetsp:Transcript_7428/g.21117  ORF Transcript_7428/g.21117 Transcript_7428/m.21117 type:complete len:262 (-) Transcript_7428:1160-1945(-)
MPSPDGSLCVVTARRARPHLRPVLGESGEGLLRRPLDALPGLRSTTQPPSAKTSRLRAIRKPGSAPFGVVCPLKVIIMSGIPRCVNSLLRRQACSWANLSQKSAFPPLPGFDKSCMSTMPSNIFHTSAMSSKTCAATSPSRNSGAIGPPALTTANSTPLVTSSSPLCLFILTRPLRSMPLIVPKMPAAGAPTGSPRFRSVSSSRRANWDISLSTPAAFCLASAASAIAASLADAASSRKARHRSASARHSPLSLRNSSPRS